MSDKPQGRVSHLTTGRMRVKIPEKRGDAGYFKEVEDRLRTWDSVDRVETNPLTGSILVFFSDLAELFAEHEAGNDLFSIDYDELANEAVDLASRAVEAFERADKTVHHWTGGTANLRTAIFASLLIGGLYQVLRGNIAAPGATLLWYAGAAAHLWDRGSPGQPLAGPSR